MTGPGSFEPAGFEIEDVTDVEQHWRDIWPLIDCLETTHGDLVGEPLRDGREATRLKAFGKAAPGEVFVSLARASGRAVGIVAARVAPGGWAKTETVARATEFFIEPAFRGRGAMQRLARHMEARTRAAGLAFAECRVYAANPRALRLWGHIGYEPFMETLRAGTQAEAKTTALVGLELRVADDLDAVWPALLPLLRARDQRLALLHGDALPPGRDQWHRARLRNLREKKGRLLLAIEDGEVTGMAAVQIVRGPWVFSGRRGVINDVLVRPDRDLPGVTAALTGELHTWAVRKQASGLEVEAPVADREAGVMWRSLGYRPHLVTLRKRL